jgi:hypothetical protein
MMIPKINLASFVRSYGTGLSTLSTVLTIGIILLQCGVEVYKVLKGTQKTN